MSFEDLIDEVMAEIPAVASTSRNFTNRSQSSSEQLNDRQVVRALKENHQEAIELSAPIESKNPARSKRRKWSLFSSATLLLATFCLAPRLAQTWTATESTAVASSVSALETESPQFLTKPIEQLRPGDRVLAHNPEVTAEERASYQEPVSTWRLVEMEVTGEDGHRVDVQLLRPRQWVEQHSADVSGQFPIDLEELGVSGMAGVLRVSPCPEIKPGNGQVVTGAFRHVGENLVKVHIEGETEPLVCTSGHPFWSEDRQKFVDAATLQPGEWLRTADHAVAKVVKVAGGPASETVYNIEVGLEHVYYVGEAGTLVHNLRCGNSNEHLPTNKHGKPIPSAKSTFLPTDVSVNSRAATQHIKSGKGSPWGSGKWGAQHHNREGHLPRTGVSGKPITYEEYYLPKSAGQPGNFGSNRIVVGSDGNVYATTTHYGQNGGTPFVHLHHDQTLQQ